MMVNFSKFFQNDVLVNHAQIAALLRLNENHVIA